MNDIAGPRDSHPAALLANGAVVIDTSCSLYLLPGGESFGAGWEFLLNRELIVLEVGVVD